MKKLLLFTTVILVMSVKASAQDSFALVPYLTQLVGTSNAQLTKDIASASAEAEQAALAAQSLQGNTAFWKMAQKADQALTSLKAVENDMRIIRILEETVMVQRRAFRVWNRTKTQYKDLGLKSHDVRAIRSSLAQCISVVDNLKNVTKVIFSKDLRTDQGQRMMLVDQTLDDVEEANKSLLKVELFLDKKERESRRIKRLADDIGLIETF